MKKVLVFLGYKLACDYDDWVEGYKKGIYNDNGPYGYKNYIDKDIKVDYFRLNNFEKKVLFSKYLKYFYVYYIKLPIILLKYDVVWTHYDKDGLFISKLRCIPLLKKLYPKQIANFVWLIDDSKDFSNRKRMRVAKYLNNIEKIIFHAKTEKQKFISYFGIDEEKLNHVFFGINFESYSNKMPMIKPNEIDCGFDYILFVGNDKHRDINCFKLIAEKFRDEKFVFITNNYNFKKQKYPDNVVVLSANLREVRWLYNNCKFVILPLKYNEHVSGCTTILEAAAFKKAVIVTYVPGIDDYIINEKTGILVKDFGEFCISIKRLLEDSKYRDKLGENAYEYCKNRFTTYNWSKEHIMLTKELLKEQRER